MLVDPFWSLVALIRVSTIQFQQSESVVPQTGTIDTLERNVTRPASTKSLYDQNISVGAPESKVRGGALGLRSNNWLRGGHVTPNFDRESWRSGHWDTPRVAEADSTDLPDHPSKHLPTDLPN